MNNPVISVIIPVFNTEAYLRKCVDSVLIQTYCNLEVWLIDDGSTDDSGIICDSYAETDHRVYVVHKENEGAAVARNLALDQCTGEYIIFIDSDDWIEPDAVQIMVNEVLQSDADLGIFGFNIHSGLRTISTSHQKDILDSSLLMKTYLTEKYITSMICNKIYKRDLLRNIRFPLMRANEDAYILPEIICEVRRAIIIPECLYNQFLRMGSMERSPFSEKKLALLEAADHMCSIVQKYQPNLMLFAELKRVKDIKALLDKIAEDGVYRNYSNIYDQLHQRFNNECEYIQTHYVLGKKENTNLESMKKEVRNVKWHLLMGRCNGIKKIAKCWLKSLLIRCKQR